MGVWETRQEVAAFGGDEGDRCGAAKGSALLRELLPAWIGQAWCDIGDADDGATRRRREFEAGRVCAARAMTAAGLPASEFGVGDHGEPIWPSGVVGSITHTDRLAMAVAAPRTRARAMGIDVEPVMTASRLDAVAERIAAPGEIAGIAARARCGAEAAATLVFSAKEALYKCLFPEVGRVFDYLDAEVEDVNLDRGRLRLRLTTALGPGWPSGTAIAGRCALDGHVVYTGIVLRARDRRTA